MSVTASYATFIIRDSPIVAPVYTAMQMRLSIQSISLVAIQFAVTSFFWLQNNEITLRVTQNRKRNFPKKPEFCFVPRRTLALVIVKLQHRIIQFNPHIMFKLQPANKPTH